MYFCVLEKPTLRKLLQFPELAPTSPDEHETLGEKSTTGLQDMMLWVSSEPKHLLVQTSCGGGTRQAAVWTKERAGSLDCGVDLELITDG